MKGMSNSGDTQAVAEQLEGNFGFTPQHHIAGSPAFLALVNVGINVGQYEKKGIMISSFSGANLTPRS